MKRLTALVVAAFAAVALYAVTAPAGQEAVSPARVTALEKKVSTLQKQMATSLKDVKDLKAVATTLAGCLFADAAAIPVASFGGTATEGYLYRLTNGTQVLESAIDVVPQSQVAQAPAWVISTTSQCATAINQASRVVDLSRFDRPAGPEKARRTLRLDR